MKFIYKSKWNLDFHRHSKIEMIDGEEYVITDITKRDLLGWKVMSGIMYNESQDKAKYALAISPREYEQLTSLISIPETRKSRK